MTKKKVTAIIALCVVLLMLVASVVTAVFLTQVMNTNVFYPVVDGEGNGYEQGKVYELPKALVFSATTPDTGIFFNVQFAPVTAVNQSVTWSIDWVNPSSAWSNGKNVGEFLALTQTSPTDPLAELKLLYPFGDQIKIRVVSNDNVSAVAECSVDYAEKFENITYDWVYSGEHEELALPNGKVDKIGDIADDLSMSMYSNIVDSEFTSSRKLVVNYNCATFSRAETFEVSAYLAFIGTTAQYGEVSPYFVADISAVKASVLDFHKPSREILSKFFVESALDSNKFLTIRNAFIRSSVAGFGIVIEVKGLYSEHKITIPVRLVMESLVKNISLGNNTIIF